jgi:transcriptional regulator with GAF, ATPase, and Fis domain
MVFTDRTLFLPDFRWILVGKPQEESASMAKKQPNVSPVPRSAAEAAAAPLPSVTGLLLAPPLAAGALGERQVAIDDLLRRALDWLGRIARYDLASIFLLRAGSLVLQVARGPLVLGGATRSALQGHTLRLADFPTLQEALETRRARVYTEEDHRHGDGDPFDGVVDLTPGHSCMVVPLCAGERCYGVMTLDRTECEPYPADVVAIAEVYGQILALALQASEQREAVAKLHEQDHEHLQVLDAALTAESVSILESSRSPAMRELVWRARQVAETDTPVLILGETGTGKERLARAIHRWSRRRDEPFVALNCAAIPAGLLESELFGHVRGAFTGAVRERQGRFALAHRGTLLLDEIGELPLELQAKLLRVVQEGRFEPVGGERTVSVDVRILAATHVDLERAVARDAEVPFVPARSPGAGEAELASAGGPRARFREDLYYRLSVFPLRLPPLRERLEDLEPLCEVLLREQASRTGRHGMHITPEAIEVLRGHRWPGNLRELANVLERATILAPSARLGPERMDVPRWNLRAPGGTSAPVRAPSGAADASRPDEAVDSPERPSWVAPGEGAVSPGYGASASAQAPLVATLEEAERGHIREALTRTGGRIYGPRGAAALLGLKPSTLQSRIKRLKIER